MTTIDRALTLFQESARHLGFTIESPSEQTLSRVSLINRDGAILVWRGTTDTLRLEITHGPGDRSQTSWLCLYEVPCVGDHVGKEVTGLALSSCIEHGLELMAPAQIVTSPPRSEAK